MDKLEIDGRRRKLLARTTTAIGGVGLALTAIPFIESMGPSEKAKAAGAPSSVAG